MAKLALVGLLCLAVAVSNVYTGSLRNANNPVVAPLTIFSFDVKFWLYTEKCPEGVEVTSDGDDVNYVQCNYNTSKTTVILIHGYLGSRDGNCMAPIVAAYNKANTSNLILADYQSLFSADYLSLVTQVKSIAEKVADEIRYLMNNLNTDISDILIIGHSAGAHIAGIASSQFPGIPRVIGLDPAGPLFDTKPPSMRLNAGDAVRVECIHTSAGLGTTIPYCLVDYFVNGGKNQPGCGLDVGGGCSHVRACLYWAESVIDSSLYAAVKTDKLKSAYDNSCGSNVSGLMGAASGKDAPGLYCVTATVSS